MNPSSPSAALALGLWLGLTMGCASARPTRYVIERDVGDFVYRRYQKTLDVEFVVAGNPGIGHTATYLRRGGHAVAFATAFVTAYRDAAALSAEVRERLTALTRYRLAVDEVGGAYAWTLTREDERWAVWVSGAHVVKVGAPRGETLPEEIADAYMDVYPSDLDEHGRAREGTRSRGESRGARHRAQTEATEERPAARSLRANDRAR